MFVNTTAASRIERAEAHLTRDVTEAVIASGRASKAFVRALGGGFASYLRPGSPMNKLIGVGFDRLIEPDLLAEIEQASSERAEPARVELAVITTAPGSQSQAKQGFLRRSKASAWLTREPF